MSLSRGCPSLSALWLSGCAPLTDQAVDALARGCHSLLSLDLSDCSGLSDRGMIILCDNDVDDNMIACSFFLILRH